MTGWHLLHVSLCSIFVYVSKCMDTVPIHRDADKHTKLHLLRCLLLLSLTHTCAMIVTWGIKKQENINIKPVEPPLYTDRKIWRHMHMVYILCTCKKPTTTTYLFLIINLITITVFRNITINTTIISWMMIGAPLKTSLFMILLHSCGFVYKHFTSFL